MRLRGEGFDLSGHDRALGEDVVKRDKAAPVEIRRLGAPLGRSCPGRCHTTSPITRAAASARPRAIQPQGVLLEEDSPLVVAGGITSGTVVVSDVVAVSVVVSDVVTVRVGVVRVGVVRVGVVRVSPVWVLSAAPPPPPQAPSAKPAMATRASAGATCMSLPSTFRRSVPPTARA